MRRIYDEKKNKIKQEKKEFI